LAGPPLAAPPRQESRLLSSAAEEPPGVSLEQVLPVVRSEERAPCPAPLPVRVARPLVRVSPELAPPEAP
jgi:hypothetical protein